MNTLVVYDSLFGNTERIAQAVADALREFGPAQAVAVTKASPGSISNVDMLIVGCPIQGWKPSPAMSAFLDQIQPGSLRGVKTGSFDTRMHLPRWLRGSAADGIAKALQSAGAEPLLQPEGFYVKGKQGPLDSGELERAQGWARLLGEKYGAARPRIAVA